MEMLVGVGPKGTFQHLRERGSGEGAEVSQGSPTGHTSAAALWEQSYVTPLPINSEFDDAFLIARIYFCFSFVHHEKYV